MSSNLNEQDSNADRMPKRPTGDVGQGPRESVPVKENDPAELARQVIERRGY